MISVWLKTEIVLNVLSLGKNVGISKQETTIIQYCRKATNWSKTSLSESLRLSFNH